MWEEIDCYGNDTDGCLYYIMASDKDSRTKSEKRSSGIGWLAFAFQAVVVWSALVLFVANLLLS